MSDFEKPVVRIDARSKVTGEALYPGDINFPNQLYMKILFSKKAHAIIKTIDTSAAEAIPGVVAIFTAKDVPNNEYGLIIPDQPVLCGPGSNKLFADRVRFIGDQIALVVAESNDVANEARKLIKVDYEELPIVTDPLEAMKDSATLLHPDRGSNTFGHFRIRKGDAEKAFKESFVTVEGTYQTPVQEHAYLQPEAGLSYYDEEGRLTVVVGGQWTHEDQEQIAHSLTIPIEKIRVIYPAIGGAFGGREDMSIQIVLALAAMRLKEMKIERPVKIIWSREESIVGHHKRHPYTIKTKWGATKEGKITAAQTELIADGGAYIYTSTKVLGNATLMCSGPYNIPNVSVDSYSVYTNNLPNGAFRGFGGPQGAYSAEMQMNKLAEVLHFDPVEIRLRNIIKEGDTLSVGTPLPPGISIEQVLRKCAEKAGWVQGKDKQYSNPKLLQKDNKYPMKSGLGISIGFKNVGFSFGAPENCWATLELHGKSEIEKAVLRHAGAEVGQGAHTIFVQMAAKALGLPLEKVQLIASDTAYTLNGGSVSASRMTFMAGNAIIGAAEAAIKKWNNEERPAIGEFQYRPPRTTPMNPETGKSEANFAYGYVAEAVECTVDVETGEISIGKVICADDVGKAVNYQQVVGQVEGAIVQAEGYAITENFIQRDGIVLTDKLSTYLIPTVLDIPEKIESIILEIPDPRGPWGARGVGEMPYLPFVPALVDSVHNATGVWYDEFPLTPERILSKLGNNEE